MRTIKFRGICIDTKHWLCGDLVQDTEGGCYIYPIDCDGLYRDNKVVSETVGQYTGMKDKHGVEIYEGDIVKSYVIKSACVNPDCDPFNLVYEGYLSKETHIVKFENGMFCVDETPLLYVGLYDLNDVKETLCVSEDEGNCDYHGTIVDESVLGIEVIGNIHDNPELNK